ncbi:MAG TPA: alpha/beta hydrolase, partial [Bacillota bacterium]|nr:alpha/beta hydrolase [Bacillota bacterium]
KNHQEIPLWNGVAPGSEGLTLTETITDSSNDPKNPSRNITGIINPTLTPCIPAKPNGTAMVVIPGGGYRNLVFDKEGTEIARWLNTFGITVFILKHRLPNEGHKNGQMGPLQDAQRAIRLIRNNARQWGVKPDRIGVMGFSAGGHLAATVGVNYNTKAYPTRDKIDKQSARPDFMVLVYAAISNNAQFVNGKTPPTFLVCGNNDRKVDPENSIRFYLALKKAAVPVELHVFGNAQHGFAIRYAEGSVRHWTTLCKEWLEEVGLL